MHFRIGTRYVLTLEWHFFRQKTIALKLPKHMAFPIEGNPYGVIIQEGALIIKAVLSTGINTSQDQITKTVEQFVLMVSISQC